MYYSPIWFVINGLCLAIGTFVIWFGIFYWLASPKGKVAFEKVLWILVGVAIVDFMFFGKHLGVLSSALRFENGMHFASKELWGNLLAVAATAGVMYLLFRYLNKHVFKAALAFVLAIAIMLPINIGNIHSQITDIRQSTEASDSVPEYTMSKTGKNVIVLMLDRAVGAFLPYIFNEKPELQAQFDGFTAYTNVISTGTHTNFGTPALMGGYEYTVEQINLRKDEKLVDKHNEALKVMPVLFDQNGFDVTVFDPIYANYQWVPDLSVFSDYPDIHRYITFGAFESDTSPKSWISANMRNFFGYSLMKACPVPMHRTDGGGALRRADDHQPPYRHRYEHRVSHGLSCADQPPDDHADHQGRGQHVPVHDQRHHALPRAAAGAGLFRLRHRGQHGV